MTKEKVVSCDFCYKEDKYCNAVGWITTYPLGTDHTAFRETLGKDFCGVVCLLEYYKIEELKK